jgi:multiple sugar transport system ATP-binding protein
MARVETRSLSKRFGEVRAVDDVALDVAEGEFLVLLGPSGCGKTTLLRLIAGIEEPTWGDVLLDGAVVTDLPPRLRNVAMVFQSYALYPHMSVRDNISFPLRMARLPRAATAEKVARAAEMFGISALLDRKPRMLSGGERQRVALARAVVREPAVFLLDEPLSNLDAKLRVQAREELRRFQKGIGVTTIHVTHDQVEAMGLADRVVVMSGGKIRQSGPPREIYDRPADTFVAAFLGSPPMNLVEREGRLMGFRPERFRPALPGSVPDGFVTLPFEITWVEDLGAERLLYGNVPGERGRAHAVSRISGTDPVSFETGRTYDFLVPRDCLRWFDRATGLRVEDGP